MHIIIAAGGMPFGPTTPTFSSLGGSETAALMLAKALGARGHKVVMFCSLPTEGPDAWPAGQKDEQGVSYQPLANLRDFAQAIPHDLLIGVRDPAFMCFPAQAKKKVLWMHDIATKKGMQKALDEMAWSFDEIWTVSEWHRQQVHTTTGYPLTHIVALRNGIVPVNVDETLSFRDDKTLIYAARPERGLDNLIKPGGIMDHLPEFKLKVAMYAHFPEHMRGYYNMIFQRMKEMPNVEFIGNLPQLQMRTAIREAAAYVYPTQFEETSCILARECIEQHTPMLTTREGALPETLGDCGLFFEDWAAKFYEDGPYPSSPGNKFWCEAFAQFIRSTLADHDAYDYAQFRMGQRNDLYWDGVAEMVEAHSLPPTAKTFSRLWSLVQDGDIIPARALLKDFMAEMSPAEDLTTPMVGMGMELLGTYDFVEGDLAEYYEKTYADKGDTAESELKFLTEFSGERHVAIANEIAKLPPGSRVLEYGCGPGHVLAPLAKQFPLIDFEGYDHSATAVTVINDGAMLAGMKNISAFSSSKPVAHDFDAVICSEVLEHVVEPWSLLQEIESYVKPGGRVIVTVPFGSWEPISYERVGHWSERFHLWQIDQQMFKDMLGDKPAHSFLHLPCGADKFCRVIGNLLMTYNADHALVKPIDALAKAMRHHPRQTLAACVIAYNNEDTILRMLNSLDKKVQFVQIALGPCKDQTAALIAQWFREHPWMRHRIINVPKIEPYKYGFDDARNASTADIAKDFDWFLWIDTDEYLAGEPNKYLRESALDGYLVAQHHFTVEPRGRAPEIDRPARLLRTGRGFTARGHIHEHFEIPKGGPGMGVLLPDVDIGHTGYVNEATRKGRFERNFPFLQWDHETNPERPLHHFLWFRDIIHRMRFEGVMAGNPARARELAVEGKAYYNAHAEAMATFGPGLMMGLAYLAEINAILGIGIPMKVAIQLDDRSLSLESRWENFDQVVRTLKQVLEPEFKDRSSRYYG